MNIKTNSVTSKDGKSEVNFLNGVTVPSPFTITIQGNVNISGVSTVGLLTASNARVSGIITAPSFIGSGIGLTLATATLSKSIALKLIIGDHPHRS